MIIEIESRRIHAATGGVEPSEDAPLVVLVHGAGMDSTVWQLQTRYLAYRGVAAIAVDLPGHGRSDGPALESIPAMAEWLATFIGALDRGQATIVGHSMGTFIALEVAAANPELVRSLVLMGTAGAMPVHPDLLDKAANDVESAGALMAGWSHDPTSKLWPNPVPGLSMTGSQRALVEMSAPGVLASDLSACATYGGAGEAAANVTAPTTVIVGSSDKMTPPRSGRAIAESLATVDIVELKDIGHSMMTESPGAVRQAILAAARG
ncbi:MAG: alpha/beta hydrolase [Actinomycetia bacterium]|nr:alpha/beta hydrolase [Actinomycetes bacterium]MCP4962910.1 alpha/beta hydrolase [Actinomycetes bacterium]